MNQQQKQYVINRIIGITNKKEKDIEKECYIERKNLGHKEKYDLIKSGKVKLKPFSFQDAYYTKNLYDFSAYETESGYTKDYRKRLDALLSHSQSLKDKVMLGDADEFLASLDTFSKMSF